MKDRLSGEQPAYLRLYQTLKEEILRGERRAGEKLPSRRQLARDYQISAVTAEHSLDLLIQEGYIEARPRSGCYVIYRETDGFAGAAGEWQTPGDTPGDAKGNAKPDQADHQERVHLHTDLILRCSIFSWAGI